MGSMTNLPGIRSFLQWGGLLVAVLAIVGGILGMHVMGGAQMASMGPATMSSPAAAPDMHAVSAPATAHQAPAETPATGPALPDQAAAPAACSCSSTCTGSMDMHGACVPSIAPAAPAAPLPGTLIHRHSWTAFAGAPGRSPQDRVPDGPSLNQLSISRT